MPYTEDFSKLQAREVRHIKQCNWPGLDRTEYNATVLAVINWHRCRVIKNKYRAIL